MSTIGFDTRYLSVPSKKQLHILPNLLSVILLIIANTAIVESIHAQNQPDRGNDILQPVTINRLEGPIEFDGRSDEPAWESIEPLPLAMYEPLYQGELTEQTEIRVGYDDNYLYVAGRLYDNEPKGVRANSLYRDRYSGDDMIAIVLDTFNDNENALWFITSPAGVRFDMAVSNDANFYRRTGETFEGANISWNTYWDVKTVQNSEGWFAEMRIPYSSLGFQTIEGNVTMGMIVYRYIARKSERQIYPAIPPNWSMGYAKPSQAQKVRLTGVSSKKPLYVTPYVLGGAEQRSALNETGDGYAFENSFTREAGADVKFNVTNNLTLDLTLNTDFAQVEADDEQVNLTRFSLFFPEKRQFFQERASIFEYRTQGPFDRLFHSRSIGLYQGETIPILGGARLVGRVGGWDVGVINMQTAEHDPLPSENFGVYRLRKQVFNTSSYAGVLATTRIGLDGHYNIAYGLDGIIRVGNQEYLQIKWAQTFEDDLIKTAGYDPLESAYGRLWFERRGQIGLTYTASVTWSGAEYNPGIGFVTRRAFTEPFAMLSYGWLLGEQSRFRSIRPNVLAAVYYRNHDGSIETALLRSNMNIDMKSGDVIVLGYEGNIEDLPDSLSFPEATSVPPGRYSFSNLNGRYNMRQGALLRTNAAFEVGSFYDGWYVQLTCEPTWNVSRFLELSAQYQFNRVRFQDRDQEFDVHLGRVRAQIGLNTKVSLNAFIQFNTSGDIVATNVRFRYNFRENNDLWIVYNEGFNMDRNRKIPILAQTDFRAVVVKYTYTFGSR